MWIWRKAKKNLKAYAYLFWNPINRIVFLFNKVECDKGLKSRGKIWVSNGDDGKVSFGKNNIINSGAWTNPIGSGNKCWFQIIGEGQLEILDNVGLSNVAITCANYISIGNNTMIGSGTRIYDTDFHILPIDKHQDKKIKSAPIFVGKNVFIGANTLVLKGTQIGDGAIIGANSVLAGCHVGANEIWAGNPARRVR